VKPPNAERRPSHAAAALENTHSPNRFQLRHSTYLRAYPEYQREQWERQERRDLALRVDELETQVAELHAALAMLTEAVTI
jgi:hypothetical protein